MANAHHNANTNLLKGRLPGDGINVPSLHLPLHPTIGHLPSVTSQKISPRRWLSRKRPLKLIHKLGSLFSVSLFLEWFNQTAPIILPLSAKKLAWDLFIMTFVMYNAVTVPFDAGFGLSRSKPQQTIDVFIDIMFVVDIFVSFRTAYMNAQGTIIRDGYLVAGHYLQTWFPVDIVAVFPFELILTAVQANSNSENNKVTYKLTRLLRTPRLLRLARLMRFLERFKNANLIRMAALMVLMVLIAHWICCVWYMLYSFTRGLTSWSLQSIHPNDVSTQYLSTLYKSYMLMVGNDVNAVSNLEKLYCIMTYIFGACFYAVVVGNMSLLVTNMNATVARHTQKKDIIRDAIRYLGIPKQLASRVDDYFDYLVEYSHPGPDGMQMLTMLPKSISRDISAWRYKSLVGKVPLFNECEEGFLKQLVSNLRVVVFLPGEVIFRIGDVGQEMYLVMKGKIAVLNQHEEMMSMLGEGTFFGELGLLATARRTAKCVALSNCDLTVVTATDLQLAMRDFPDSAEKVRWRALQRLEELQVGGNVNEEETFAHAAPAHLKRLNPNAASDLHAGNAPTPRGDHPGYSGEDLPGLRKGSRAQKPGSPTSAEAMMRSTFNHEGPVKMYPRENAPDPVEMPALANALMDKVTSTIELLSKKMGGLEQKMSSIESRLGRIDHSGVNPMLAGTGWGARPQGGMNAMDFDDLHEDLLWSVAA